MDFTPKNGHRLTFDPTKNLKPNEMQPENKLQKENELERRGTGLLAI
jgi:hypothetical protein